MILADENIDWRIIEALRKEGVKVLSVREKFPSISDKEVISLSKNPNRIILTEDKDFGEWVFAHGVRDISVILLRFHFSEIQQIIRILSQLIEEKGSFLFGKYITITVNKIRIREL